MFNNSLNFLLVVSAVFVFSENFSFATLLSEAVRMKDATEVARIIASGANVDEEGVNGVTPLILAVGSGNAEIVQQLLQAGASLHPANYPDTPLMDAVIHNHPEIVQQLLQARADVNHTSRIGRTALVSAAWMNHPASLIRQLLEAGANVNQEHSDQHNNPGKTALFFAAQYGNLESVRQLLEAGARVRQVDVDNIGFVKGCVDNITFTQICNEIAEMLKALLHVQNESDARAVLEQEEMVNRPVDASMIDREEREARSRLSRSEKEVSKKIKNQLRAAIIYKNINNQQSSHDKDMQALDEITKIFGDAGIKAAFRTPRGCEWRVGDLDSTNRLHKPFLKFCEKVFQGEKNLKLKEFSKIDSGTPDPRAKSDHE